VFSLNLFGTAGIRLKYGLELDSILAYKIGLAVSSLKLSRESYIVYDTRTTSEILTLGLSAGLLSGGVDVNIIGLAPTPVAGYSARKYRAIGVSVTASHNPPEYNGFKLYDPEGYEFTRALEKIVEERVEKGVEPVEWNCVGKLFLGREHVIYEYLNDLVEYIGDFKKQWNPIIVIDIANGAAYKLSPELIRILGGKPLTINAYPSGFFPIRKPEPRKDVLENYMNLYREVKPAVILAHDGDADRVAVLDPVRGFVKQDCIIAFYAYLALSNRKGRVVVSIDTGRVVDDIVEKMNGTVERYVLGKIHERIKETGSENIIIAAEPWKLIDPQWGPWVDGLLQVGLITREIVSRGKPFVKILEDIGIREYPWDRRSYSFKPDSLREIVYNEIVEDLKSILGEPVNVIDIDGYRYEYSDYSWILVRKSGTEPKIRLYSEALSSDRLREMVSIIDRRIREIVKKQGGEIIEITIG